MYSDWTDEQIVDVHKKHVSISQSRKSKNGASLENIVGGILREDSIPYQSQVSIDKDGIITPRGSQTHTIIDIVIGCPVVGDSIRNYTVLSLKTTSRERVKQDDWAKIIPPKLFIYVTTSNDYPPPNKFNESDIRKIITCKPKARDIRKFKLGFEALIGVLRDSLQSDV
jgi:hypothetical protein